MEGVEEGGGHIGCQALTLRVLAKATVIDRELAYAGTYWEFEPASLFCNKGKCTGYI